MTYRHDRQRLIAVRGNGDAARVVIARKEHAPRPMSTTELILWLAALTLLMGLMLLVFAVLASNGLTQK